MKKVIEIENLNKYFGEVHAVRDLTFSVGEGELFAFLGINGAGKSTTISILCSRLKKDSGTVRIDGQDIDHASLESKRSLGVVFQQSVLDKALNVHDNLKCRAALYGITGKEFEERLAELSKQLAFEDILNRTVGKLSGGQRRRIDIARALFHKPHILILDEPTTGLDPQTRANLWRVISQIRKETQMTVFLTTHYMEEATDADRILILDNGQIVAEGTPLSLKNRFTGDFISLYGVTRGQAESLQHPIEEIPGGFRIAVKNTQEATDLIVRHPELFSDYEIVKGKMDDVFLAATGKKLGGTHV